MCFAQGPAANVEHHQQGSVIGVVPVHDYAKLRDENAQLQFDLEEQRRLNAMQDKVRVQR